MTSPAAGTPRPTVLLVDDVQDIRTAFRYILELSGFDVRDTWYPPEAIALVEEKAVDVAVIDLYMPGEMDGIALIKALRAKGQTIPIIAMSGVPHAAYEASLRTARQRGANAVLTKPIEAKDLVETVRRVMKPQT